MKPIILVVGVPASGKSWTCGKLLDKFEYVHHDLFIKMTGDAYVQAILEKAKTAARPLLCEAPFSISQTKDPLEARGHRVIPVFIYEQEPVLRARWKERGMINPPTIKGHLTRQETYRQRAGELGAFIGSSAEVLKHLKEISL